ncbi:hypothetical protein JTB14_010431 [Gonioctena quinquepunctata]|nr:hypothetical protein JTB14_010431 [Gonioctena quinquepunctata]
MSDTSEDTIQSDVTNEKEGICRDFVRGQCERKFCKYKHDTEARTLNFCHDFQNHVCPRVHCKFIHCSTEEVDEYKLSGQMSYQILVEATRKNQLPGILPVCNQFKKGQCRRSGCKFRHITKEQEDAEIREMLQNNAHKQPPILVNNNVNEAQLITLASLNGALRRNGVSFDEYAGEGLPFLKRRLLSTQEQEFVPCEVLEANGVGRPVFKGYFAGNPPSPMLSRVDARTLMLEEEYSLLHKEIARLKKQVSDLTATNEFLLDQNANLRMSGKRNGAVNVPAAVTLTNTNTQQQAQQVNRTVIASVATVPVSLATVSTCNPVSGNHSVSIAGCPSVSIASPGQLLANSQQILVTTNPTTQLAIANSSQQLAIAQQNLANNLAAQQAQPQLTSQAQQPGHHHATADSQQLALANNQQAQQLALASTNQQLTSQAQHQAQQLALATTTQQLTSQAQQLALASTNQQLTSQAQQLAMASTTQQLTSQAQQLAMANTSQQLTVTSVPQQLTLASTNQQLIAAQQNLASELHRSNQMNAIATSQAIAMSNASQPMVSYPIMTQSINHALTH